MKVTTHICFQVYWYVHAYRNRQQKTNLPAQIGSIAVWVLVIIFLERCAHVPHKLTEVYNIALWPIVCKANIINITDILLHESILFVASNAYTLYLTYFMNSADCTVVFLQAMFDVNTLCNGCAVKQWWIQAILLKSAGLCTDNGKYATVESWFWEYDS